MKHVWVWHNINSMGRITEKKSKAIFYESRIIFNRESKQFQWPSLSFDELIGMFILLLRTCCSHTQTRAKPLQKNLLATKLSCIWLKSKHINAKLGISSRIFRQSIPFDQRHTIISTQQLTFNNSVCIRKDERILCWNEMTDYLFSFCFWFNLNIVLLFIFSSVWWKIYDL